MTNEEIQAHFDIMLANERGLTDFICKLYNLDKEALRMACLEFKLDSIENNINNIVSNVFYVDFCHDEI